MNVRKPVDYSAMFVALDKLVAAGLPQMELYCEIGRLVSGRLEKGAVAAAAEYLRGAYPDASGLSPRNLRRMREFYRTYENAPEVLAQAMTIGWTQNVVILEAELTLPERAWYIQAAGQFGWSKLELQRKIADNAHLEIALDFTGDICCIEETPALTERVSDEMRPLHLLREYLPQTDRLRCQLYRQTGPPKNNGYGQYRLPVGVDEANPRNMHRLTNSEYNDIIVPILSGESSSIIS